MKSVNKASDPASSLIVHAHEPRNLLQDIEYWARQRPVEPWLVEQWRTGRREVSWAEGSATIDAAAAWLSSRLPARGSRVGLMGVNCAHWTLADYAIMASGNVTVPIFTSMDADSVAYVADFAGIELLVLGDAANWDMVRDSFPAGITVVTIPGAPEVPGAIAWDEVVAAGAGLDAAEAPDETALATIVFTSGTTGRPKGVMHSLRSLRQAGGGMGFTSQTLPGHRFLSYLPLAHLGERVVLQTHALVYGGTVFFNESQETFLSDLRNARPNWMFGAPRIWEKLQQAVLAHVASQEELDAAKANNQLEKAGHQVREFLGLDDIHFILTASAPTPAPLKAWYRELGITLYDGYGQSEILPISLNSDDNYKLESIGAAAHGVEIRIAEDGEILCRGGGTAMGYYLAPDKTAETFEPDGWVHTGDKGRLDEDGHLYITGRVKEIFKTAKGKYVAPSPIEGRFQATHLVEQACLTGLGLAQTVMIVVLAAGAAKQHDEAVSRAICDWTRQVNDGLENHERIGALVVSREPWSQENGVLTHTLKIRRDYVEERYSSELEQAGDRMREGEPLFVIFADDTKRHRGY